MSDNPFTPMSDNHYTPEKKIENIEAVRADRKRSLLKIATILAYLFFLVQDLYTAEIFPQLSAFYENHIQQTYFTPDARALLVWPIIHILLLCTICYSRRSDRGKAIVIDKISGEFPLLIALYAAFVTFRANDYPTVAFGLSFCLLYVGFSINYITLEKYSPESVREELSIIFPISACLAWSTVIFCVSAFEAFGVDALEQAAGTWTKFFVVVAL